MAAQIDTAPVTQPSAPMRRATVKASTVARRVAEADAPHPAINHPLYAVEGIAAASGFAHVAQEAPWWFVAGGGLAAVVGAAVAKARWRHAGTTLYTGISCAAAGVTAAIGTEFGPWSGPGLGSLLLSGVALGPWYGYLRYRHNGRVAKELAKEAARRELLRAERKHHDWEAILAKAGAKDVHVCTDLNDDTWAHGERKFEAGFALALDLGEEAPTIRELAGYTPQIEKIAARRLTMQIRTGAIQILPRGYAHEAEIIVPTRDILKETFPMPLLPEPRSVNDPICACIAVDGTPIGWTPADDPHGMFAGKTNSGKSTFLQANAVELTRCVDNVTWMIVGNKPVRNFAPWLHPFLKRLPCSHTKSGFVEPVIDWVAADIAEACRMACDAYKAISIRQRKASVDGADKWTVTPDSPRITILIDESPDFLTNETYKCKPWDWDGNTDEEDEEAGIHTGMPFSEILLKVVRLARSEGISVVFLTQRGTSSMVGADAGDLKSQITFRTGFKQAGWIEKNATFNTEDAGVDVAALRQGELYIEMDGYSRPVLAKGYYPSPELIQQAAIQNCAWAQPLDDYTADELDYYAGRWTRPSQQDFLRQVLPSAVRTIPYQGIADQPEQPKGTVTTATAAAAPEDAPTSAMAAFEQWVAAEHQGEDITQELFEQFIQERWQAASPQERATLLGERPAPPDEGPEAHKAREIDLLERMFSADSAEEPEPPVSQVGPVIDPTLPQRTRELLTLLARSDLLYDEWVATRDIVTLAEEELGWPGSTPGARRVHEALNEVNVFQPANRPKTNGKKWPSGFWAADIKQALAAVTQSDQPEDDEDGGN
jgi:hypothetical protein